LRSVWRIAFVTALDDLLIAILLPNTPNLWVFRTESPITEMDLKRYTFSSRLSKPVF
jgi:hypothetical protein